jgi:transcriptional regulator with XRE-family HTH domain
MTANPADGAAWIPDWTLGDRLRKVRRHLGISQSEFAVMIEQNPKSYSSWESDQAQPRQLVSVAKRIEIATGVPASWVLGLASNLDTGTDTRRYPTGSSPSTRMLSLVPAPTGGYPAVSGGYASSATRPGYGEAAGSATASVGVNNADAA